MNRQRYLALLRKAYPTAASASAAKLALAKNLRARPSDTEALLEFAGALRTRASECGCAYLQDIAETFELSAALPQQTAGVVQHYPERTRR